MLPRRLLAFGLLLIFGAFAIPQAWAQGAAALFGFERTGALSIQPTEEIAQTAQAFGQDDDITAVVLARVPILEAGLA